MFSVTDYSVMNVFSILDLVVCVNSPIDFAHRLRAKRLLCAHFELHALFVLFHVLKGSLYIYRTFYTRLSGYILVRFSLSVSMFERVAIILVMCLCA